MTFPDSADGITRSRKRFIRCLLNQGAIIMVIIALCAAFCIGVLGFDAKHIVADLLLIFVAIALHLRAERIERSFSQLQSKYLKLNQLGVQSQIGTRKQIEDEYSI